VCLFSLPHFPCKVLTSRIMVSQCAGFLKNITPFLPTNGVCVLSSSYYGCCWSCLACSVTWDSLLRHLTGPFIAGVLSCIQIAGYPYYQILTLYSTVVTMSATHLSINSLYIFLHNIFMCHMLLTTTSWPL
jgi:hypothetical protein